MGDRFRKAVETCLFGNYLEQLDAVLLDASASEEGDERGNPETVTTSYEIESLTQLSSFCRCVVAELSRCQYDLGDEASW